MTNNRLCGRHACKNKGLYGGEKELQEFCAHHIAIKGSNFALAHFFARALKSGVPLSRF